MTMANLLSTTVSAPLRLSYTHKASFFSNFSSSFTLSHLPPQSLINPAKRSDFGKRAIIIVQAKKDSDLADAPDRLISAICYFYPFFDGVQYGKYVITQFAPIQALIQPLVPAIKVFKSFPFNGFLIFLTLYFVVVRNSNFSRYVRFNTMQAIVLDVLLIFPDLFERTFNPKEGVGLDLMMSFDSTVFFVSIGKLDLWFLFLLVGSAPKIAPCC